MHFKKSPAIIIILFFSLWVFTSCNGSTDHEVKKKKSHKEDVIDVEEDEPSISKSDLIGVYTISGLKVETEDGNVVDMYSKLNYCEKHNRYAFSKNNVWSLGGVSNNDCTGPDESGTWTLKGKTIKIKSDQSGAYDAVIQKFDGNKLVVKSKAEQDGKTYTYITTYKRMTEDAE